MRFLLLTDPGLEQVAAEEALERDPDLVAEPVPYGHPGQLRVETRHGDRLGELSTIHHVIEIRGEGSAGEPDAVRDLLGDLDFPELATAASFRVTTGHSGSGGMSRVDLQQVSGGVLQRRYGTPVDLEHFAINVRVDRYENHLVAGLQRTRASLGNRIRRLRALRSALKPTVAAAMLRLAGAHRGAGRLIDPLCGGGTIPIEARRLNPALDVFACDWDPDTVENARTTIDAHVTGVDLRICDARSLRPAYGESFDFIVTDPPYGARQARRASLTRLYRTLLQAFESTLTESGCVVVIVLKHGTFRAALESVPLRIVDERVVDLGGMSPRILVLRRG